jgi:hypothetical protein
MVLLFRSIDVTAGSAPHTLWSNGSCPDSWRPARSLHARPHRQQGSMHCQDVPPPLSSSYGSHILAEERDCISVLCLTSTCIAISHPIIEPERRKRKKDGIPHSGDAFSWSGGALMGIDRSMCSRAARSERRGSHARDLALLVACEPSPGTGVCRRAP